MAQLLLAAAGAGIGGALTQFSSAALLFGMSGMQLGWAVGGVLGGMLFAPSQPNVTSEGPRISDLKVTSADYGTPIPIAYGTVRMAGSIIWASDLIETKHEDTSSGGSKGGSGGGSVTQVSYTYSDHLAFAICESQDGRVSKVQKVLRIWANGDLIYDATGAGDPIQDTRIVQNGNLRIYLGGEDQMPDALIQAYEGTANVPAFRGLAYVVFEDLQLQKYGNRPPSITFEVCTSITLGTPATPTQDVYTIDPSAYKVDNAGSIYIPQLTEYWMSMYQNSTSDPIILRLRTDGTVIGTIGSGGNWVGPDFFYTTAGMQPLYDPDDNAIYLSGDYGSILAKVDLGSMTLAWVQDLNYSAGTMFLDQSGLLWVYNDLSYYGLWQVNKATGGHLTEKEMPFFIGNEWIVVDGALFTTPYYTTPVGKGYLYEVNLFSNWQIQRWRYEFGGGYPFDDPTWDILLLGYDDVLDGFWVLSMSVETNTQHLILVSHHEDSPYETIQDRDTGKTNDQFFYNPNSHQIWQTDQFGTEYVKILDVADLDTPVATLTPEAGFRTFSNVTNWQGSCALVADSDLHSGVGYWPIILKTCPGQATPDIPNAIGLGNIIHDLNLRAGLQDAQINTAALTQLVRGYVVTRQMSARAGIEPLQSVWFFDGTESDAVMKYVNRGAAAIATISDDELGYGGV